jgi:hypothetical protein
VDVAGCVCALNPNGTTKDEQWYRNIKDLWTVCGLSPQEVDVPFFFPLLYEWNICINWNIEKDDKDMGMPPKIGISESWGVLLFWPFYGKIRYTYTPYHPMFVFSGVA